MPKSIFQYRNEQFIVDERGSKQAVIIPFPNYLKSIDIMMKPSRQITTITIWQTHKGSDQSVKAWLAADTDENYPVGNPKYIDHAIQEIRDAWGNE